MKNYHLTYNEARNLFDSGLMTEHDWRVYHFFWMWTTPRFSGAEGILHDRVYDRLGRDRYRARINRVRRMAGLSQLGPV